MTSKALFNENIRAIYWFTPVLAGNTRSIPYRVTALAWEDWGFLNQQECFDLLGRVRGPNHWMYVARVATLLPITHDERKMIEALFWCRYPEGVWVDD